MINKSTIKLIKSLVLKKYRLKERLFLVEGDKNVREVLDSSYSVERLYATDNFISFNEEIIQKAGSVYEVEKQEIKKASLLKNPQNSLAICTLPEIKELPQSIKCNLTVYLDGIQDPGNLGTIIRICDWFGAEHLFCSVDSVDFFNPKVIQASMGSFSRLSLWQSAFEPVVDLTKREKIKIYGTFLNGKNIYKEQFPDKVLFIMGNEGKGIRESLIKFIDHQIYIPPFGKAEERAESLNVSIATAVMCSEFRRRAIL